GREPETGVENVGCYRVMLHDKDKVGLYISPGKHGKMHYEKAMRAGKPFPVAMVFGQHPLLFIAASQAVPFGVNEYDWTGGLLGQPIEVIEGPLTGLRFPATAEIAIEGEIIPGDAVPKGPLGEWPGFYAAAPRPEPFVRLRAYTIATGRLFVALHLLSQPFTVCIGPACGQPRYGTEWSRLAFPTFVVFICLRQRNDS